MAKGSVFNWKFTYLGILVICISTTANGIGFTGKHIRDVKEKLNSQLNSYTLLRPYRSTPEGEFFKHSLDTEYEGGQYEYRDITKARRERRSSESINQKNFHFKLNGNGIDMNLNVTTNRWLIKPGLQIEFVHDNVTTRKSTVYRKCHYFGQVVGDPDSRVAISTCHGLHGWIAHNREDYLIEPITLDFDPVSSAGQLHVIYKKSAVKSSDSDNSVGNKYGIDLSNDMLLLNDTIKKAKEHRQRRALSRDQVYTIELMVAADYTVINLQGEAKIEDYVLTMVNIADRAYSHPTIEAQVNLAVVRIIALDERSSKYMIIESNMAYSRHQVCSWATTLQSLDETNKNHFDAMVFLSRRKSPQAGIAMVTGMCKWTQNCAIVKDQGLPAAFIVAHEIGHLMGMMHDTTRNNCSYESTIGSIMAPLVTSNYNKYFWSKCSRDSLKAWMHVFTCLLDSPFDAGFREPSVHPGKLYTLSDQCRYVMGDGHEVCPWAVSYYGYDPCQTLLCHHPQNGSVCAHDYAMSPALDGTPCGDQGWCMQGRCTRTNKQHGGWSSWTEWSGCSYGCGGGVSIRVRECNDPAPLYGGDDCAGDYMEYRVCNEAECQHTREDIRELYCEGMGEYENVNTGSTGVWKPYESGTSGDERCSLSCENRLSGARKTFDFTVVDGTPCSYDSQDDLCMGGRCRKLGCDFVLGSTQREDSCGVCGGDNSACIYPENRYKQILTKTLQKIYTFPRNSRHIEIIRPKSSYYHLAFQNAETGQMLFNTKDLYQRSTQIIEAHSRFVVSNLPKSQRILTRGPLSYPITLYANPIYNNSETKSDVTYRYIIHKNQFVEIRTTAAPTTEPPDTYTWTPIGWTECSKSCDGGWTYFEYKCIRGSDEKTVKRTFCGKGDYNPKTLRSECNAHECPVPIVPQVVVTEQDIELSNATYLKESSLNLPATTKFLMTSKGANWKSAQVIPRRDKTSDIMLQGNRNPLYSVDRVMHTLTTTCSEELTRQSQSCYCLAKILVNKKKFKCMRYFVSLSIDIINRYDWTVSDWRECSSQCGLSGRSRRSARCTLVQENGRRVTVPDDHCQNAPPATTQACNRRPCLPYWYAEPWGECDGTCGLGVQHRSVKCIEPPDEPEKQCKTEKPAETRRCILDSCIKGCQVVNNPICTINMYEKYCNLRGFMGFCCRSCEELRVIYGDD
ncbi:A disintegrin and metalloproteinase with thrombospondin motifs 3-like [Anneissia japonica]|uniref:A disintegrin and metalloproteinase with thrombospondin motifs 3-like n=1 Tax=Anneissia japonica TaxID=1529436 RepID=UPI0014256BC4|nr:A disintegrin and metalloproteinase with thrombospondin motifs 3-like [Anneissia japonica]